MQRFEGLGVEHQVRSGRRLYPDLLPIRRDAEHPGLAALGEVHPLCDLEGLGVEYRHGVLVALRNVAERTVRREIDISGEGTHLDTLVTSPATGSTTARKSDPAQLTKPRLLSGESTKLCPGPLPPTGTCLVTSKVCGSIAMACSSLLGKS